MSQTSTHPALKWILIVIAVVTALGAVFVALYATRPADEYRVASELEKRGFTVGYNWCGDNKIWKRPTAVSGNGQKIKSDDIRFLCQLPCLVQFSFIGSDASDLNLDEIGNCQKLCYFTSRAATRFPVRELKKLTASPVMSIDVASKDVDLNDSDLEEFVKFAHLQLLKLECNNAGVTDACLEYFEKIPTLRKLELPGSSITPEGVEEFQKKRPDVTVDYE